MLRPFRFFHCLFSLGTYICAWVCFSVPFLATGQLREHYLRICFSVQVRCLSEMLYKGGCSMFLGGRHLQWQGMGHLGVLNGHLAAVTSHVGAAVWAAPLTLMGPGIRLNRPGVWAGLAVLQALSSKVKIYPSHMFWVAELSLPLTWKESWQQNIQHSWRWPEPCSSRAWYTYPNLFISSLKKTERITCNKSKVKSHFFKHLFCSSKHCDQVEFLKK